LFICPFNFKPDLFVLTAVICVLSFANMQEHDSRSRELDELASQSNYNRRNLQQYKEEV
jgi:hypothetical protein